MRHLDIVSIWLPYSIEWNIPIIKCDKKSLFWWNIIFIDTSTHDPVFIEPDMAW